MTSWSAQCWRRHGSSSPDIFLTNPSEFTPARRRYGRLCGARGTAEDLTSETFRAATDAAHGSDPPPIAISWLRGATQAG